MKRISLPLLVGCLSGAVAAAEKPNILFLFADDQCFETIHALNNPEVETPYLDTLVAEGTSFTHAYNSGAWGGAVCVASRTMLNTGRQLWAANAGANTMKQTVEEAGKAWSQQLRKAGYRTYMTGKWHVRLQPEALFDVVGTVRAGMPNQTKEGYNRPIDGQPDPWDPADPKFGGFWKGGKHWSEVVADETEGFLEASAKDNKPFFMYVAFNAVHDPRQAPQEYLDKYPVEDVQVPKNFLSEYPYDFGVRSIRDEKLAPYPRTHRSIQVNRREYYAILTHMDVQIGRILKALEKTGQADNTLVVFTADHGLGVGQHGLLGKQNMYDHSVRVPFIMRGKQVAAGKRISAPIYFQDIVPTTLETAGVPQAGNTDFRSVWPLLKGEVKSTYSSIYGGYMGTQRMITHDGWKLILYPKLQKLRLYHLAKDPLEMNNRGDEAGMLQRKKFLFKELQKEQQRLHDALDLTDAFPDLAGK